MLHKTSKNRGFRIQATDGDIGHVDDVLVDEAGWLVRYLLVDTSNWIGGKGVLVSPSVITAVDRVGETIAVPLTRDQIENGPSVEQADIARIETSSTVWIM